MFFDVLYFAMNMMFIHSFVAFSTLLGIREGTVASAILIGLFVKQFKKPVERWVKRVTGIA